MKQYALSAAHWLIHIRACAHSSRSRSMNVRQSTFNSTPCTDQQGCRQSGSKTRDWLDSLWTHQSLCPARDCQQSQASPNSLLLSVSWRDARVGIPGRGRSSALVHSPTIDGWGEESMVLQRDRKEERLKPGWMTFSRTYLLSWLFNVTNATVRMV